MYDRLLVSSALNFGFWARICFEPFLKVRPEPGLTYNSDTAGSLRNVQLEDQLHGVHHKRKQNALQNTTNTHAKQHKRYLNIDISSSQAGMC